MADEPPSPDSGGAHGDEYDGVAGASGGGGGGADGDGAGSVREQDRFLPVANISRIMKKALPANAKIAKDAKETVQECVSEYISFITSEYSPLDLSTVATVSGLPSAFTAAVAARQLPCRSTKLASDKCQREKRKTINGDDLLWAMSTLGFEDCIEPLKLYLHKFREEALLALQHNLALTSFHVTGVSLSLLRCAPNGAQTEGEKASLAKQGGDSLKKDASGASSGQMPMSNFGPSSTMGYMQPQMQLQPSQQL
eukprot:SM000002S05674  [mRNA]  locus=s2:1564347:1566142:+ [translate_table: standard]